jgi:hypothetical protein
MGSASRGGISGQVGVIQERVSHIDKTIDRHEVSIDALKEQVAVLKTTADIRWEDFQLWVNVVVGFAGLVVGALVGHFLL